MLNRKIKTNKFIANLSSIYTNNIIGKKFLPLVYKLSLYVHIFCISFPGTNNPFKKYSLAIFIISGFMQILINRTWKNFNWRKSNWYLILIPIFYLLGFIYLPWDSNIDRLLWVQERKLALFFVPLVILFVGLRSFNLKRICQILMLGTLYSIISVIILQYQQDSLHIKNFFTLFNHVRANSYSHHVPFNLLLNFSFVSSIYLLTKVKRKKIYEILFYIFTILVTSTFLLNTEGRIGLLTYAISLVVISIFYIGRYKLWLGIISFIIVGSVGAIIFMNHPRVKRIKSNKISTVDKAGQLPRIFIWGQSWEMIQERPILGYGIGDAQTELNRRYSKHNYNTGVSNNFHSHDQFLQGWTQFGIIGLLFSLYILLYPIFFYIKRKRNELILFMGICLFIANITEPLLQVAFGIYPFCLVLFIMFCKGNIKSEE